MCNQLESCGDRLTMHAARTSQTLRLCDGVQQRGIPDAFVIAPAIKPDTAFDSTSPFIDLAYSHHDRHASI